MERPSGLDASFLYCETPSPDMHTLKYPVLDVEGVEGGFSVDRLRHELAQRLHLLPPFGRRRRAPGRATRPRRGGGCGATRRRGRGRCPHAVQRGHHAAHDVGGGTRLTGNKVSNLFTSLRTDLEDPVERLDAIHAVAGAAKEVRNVLGADMLADWMGYTRPRRYAWAMRLYSRWNLADRHRPPINLVVSNVPGPRDPLDIVGARLAGIWSVGPILEGVGLNVTVWSYLDRVHVGVIGCREHWRDLHVVSDGMVAAMADLLALAEKRELPDAVS